jgi:DNA polymerase III subunit gamma/tau
MYTVIARKYRPQTFSEVVNQEHIKQTLRNAIEQKRLAHGYIFSGQRGTGKTTMARLLAKSLNCSGRPADTVEPCGKCSSCTEVATGSAVDVIEIDAASNRGIDDIRGLRENARYAPSRDPYKFFIVDEAHQLTKEAWNALLKTLEEPPPHVIFVLCTTEAHSIPQTIVSRCQTFAFHNLGFEETVRQLEHICKSEGIEATEEALAVITQAGEGSLRDSLSTLDQAIACCGNKLDGQALRQLLGVVTTQALDEVVEAISTQSPERALALVDSLVREGQNLRNFAAQLARHIRNLLVVKTAPNSPQLVEASRAERERISGVAAGFSEEDLTRYLQIVLRLYQDLQHSPQPRFHTELGLMKLIHAGRLAAIEEVLARLESGGGAPPAAPPSGRGPAGPSPFERDQSRRQAEPPRRPPSSPVSSHASTPPVAAVPAPASSDDSDVAGQLMARVEAANKMMLSVNLERAVSWDVRADSVTAFYPPGTSMVNLPSGDDQRMLGNMASEILGRPVTFRASLLRENAAPPATAAPAQPAAKPPASAPASSSTSSPASSGGSLQNIGALADHPEIADFVRFFPGAKIEEQKRK